MNSHVKLLAAAIALFSLGAQAQDAQNGTITVNGEVLSSTCNVEIGTGNATGFNSTVTLASVSASEFTSANQIAKIGQDANNISINLSKCANSVSSVLVTASGANNAKGIIDTNSTTKVDLIVLKGPTTSDDPVNLAATTPQYEFEDSDANAYSVPLYVGYYGPTDPADVKSGDLSGVVKYTVNYN